MRYCYGRTRDAGKADQRRADTGVGRRGRGRPTVGDGPGTVVTARLDEATISALTQKAKAEGITTRSEAIRVAVRQWAHVA